MSELINKLEPRAYRINDFIAAFGLGRTSTYRLIKDGKLPSVMVGGRRLIPADAAEALLRPSKSILENKSSNSEQ
jgi:excisionase family DNA binding protein